MQPGDLYVVLIVLTAICVAPFSRLALVIVVAWTIGHFVYVAGVPETWVNLVQHICAAAAGMRCARRTACAFAWALFAPLIAVDLSILFANFDPEAGWGWVLAIASAQLIALPFGMDTGRARAVFKAWKESPSWDRMIGGPGLVAV